MTPAIAVHNIVKRYDGGFLALDDVSLSVQPGEIFALLGPNGAGKTTLISIITGIVTASGGRVEVLGLDTVKDYRQARRHIGLVPQELTTDAFETVWNTVSFSRGLFDKPANRDYLEELLKRLSLWDKKNAQLRMLSGGMKRRVMIAKALSHEPDILFLDEPSAGVDVELRKSMWDQVRALRDTGVTVILTTHYLEEAEQMADRIGVINQGKLILVENKKTLMKKLGKKELVLELCAPLGEIPTALSGDNLHLSDDGMQLIFTYDPTKEDNGPVGLLERLKQEGVKCRDINTRESSLEEIFVQLVGEA
ncbi:ABC transporter ATP-binding protein [Paremcibacter congregatus]|uniref:ABC transporter ATP-binding protein n=1 Tax=Paremcibacter congregatus TaxID=2043170 RepID=UPI003A8EF058